MRKIVHHTESINYDVVRNTFTESWTFIKVKTTIKKKRCQQMKNHSMNVKTKNYINYSKTQ